MSQFDRSELMSLAEICHDNDRNEDVISYIKEVIKMGTPLNFEERIIIYNSYQNLKLPYQRSFVSCDDLKVDEKLQREINQKAQSEINRISDDAIELINSYWIKRDTNIEAAADYKSFLALQHENKAFVASGEDKELELNEASILYEEAFDLANKNLNPAHPVAIDVARFYSDFLFRSRRFVDKARSIATEAYEKGLSGLPDLLEELKDAANITLEKLKEQIDSWN